MEFDSPGLISERVRLTGITGTLSIALLALGLYLLSAEVKFLVQSDPVDATVVQSYSYVVPCRRHSSCIEYGNRVRFTRPNGVVTEQELLATDEAYPAGTKLALNVRWGTPDKIRVHSISSLFGKSLLVLFASMMLFIRQAMLEKRDSRARKSLRSGFFSKTFKAAYDGQFQREEGSDHRTIGRRTAFMVSAFSMFAKMAKADAKITDDEVTYVDRIIGEQFHFDEQSRKVAIQIFRHAQGASHTFAEHAAEFERIFHREPRMLRQMLELLHQLALADGVLSPSEESLLAQASEIFGIPSSRFESHWETNSRIKASADAYQILGVSAGASLSEIKRAYRLLVKENHPDTLISRGLPPELVRAAADRFRKVQAAYEEILKAHK